jgi:hypothetical protein
MTAPRATVERGLQAIAGVIRRRDPDAFVEVVLPPKAAAEPEQQKTTEGRKGEEVGHG